MNGSAQRQPNIVLLLADDLGYGDLTCYNAESRIPSPQTDRIAHGGMRFTDAHSGSSVCSPTRYGLLTGRYAWRTRLKNHVLRPFDPPLIEAGELTLPGMLRSAGYHTACIGKWHLGWNWPKHGGEIVFDQPISDGPTTRGFDRYFGTDVPNYPPYCFIEDDRTVGLPAVRKTEGNLDGPPGPMLPGWRTEGILPTLADRAEAYIAGRASSPKPFFLYFPLTSPHEPITPSRPFQGKSGINPVADLMLETDAVVGRMLDRIERAGIASNTIVIYASDNGHSTYTGLEALEERGHRPSGPWRGYKGSIYEGGHRVPLLVRWPGKVKPNSTSSQLVCLNDLMAMFAESLQLKLPPGAAPDSISFLPALEGRKGGRSARSSIVNHSGGGQFAIRERQWKLILPALPPANTAKPEVSQEELYDLNLDPAERTNLAQKAPEVVGHLSELLEKTKAHE